MVQDMDTAPLLRPGLALLSPLPGREAQYLMAPRYRVGRREVVPPDARLSAVLVALVPPTDGTAANLLDWRVLLIQRATYPGAHSGQVSFPGGKCEDCDDSAWDTACREAEEEVSLDRKAMVPVGPLTSVYVSASNFLIKPFAAVYASGREPRADGREAAGCKLIPVGTFDPARAVDMEFPYRDGSFRAAPAWQYEDFTIWGATAMILAELHQAVTREILVPSP